MTKPRCRSAVWALVFSASIGWHALASAAATSTASLFNLGYAISDLDADDGIISAASFSALAANYASATATHYTDFGVTLVADSADLMSADGLLGPATAQATQSHSSAAAGVTSGSLPQTTTLQATGSASGGADSAALSTYSAYAGGPASASFTLTAGSSITFTAQVSLSASTTVGYSTATGGLEFATAYFSMWIDGTGADGTGYQSALESDSLYASYQYDSPSDSYSPESLALYRVATVTFTNLSSTPLEGTLTMDVSTYGESAITPVPEPSMAVLMAAGAAVLSMARRRHPAKLAC